jgi:hypothetical protein
MPPIRLSDLQSAITTVVSLRPDQLSRRLYYNAALQKRLQGPAVEPPRRDRDALIRVNPNAEV